LSISKEVLQNANWEKIFQIMLTTYNISIFLKRLEVDLKVPFSDLDQMLQVAADRCTNGIRFTKSPAKVEAF